MMSKNNNKKGNYNNEVKRPKSNALTLARLAAFCAIQECVIELTQMTKQK